MSPENFELIDLTHSLTSEIAYWSGHCGFEAQIETDYADCRSDTKFRIQKLAMYAGIGTHIDAPLHCFANTTSVADIPLEKLIAPCYVIDVPKNIPEDYCLTCDDVETFERNYGEIKPHSLVMIRTGWGKHWDDAKKYRNNLIFPTVSAHAAEMLLAKDIVGLGIDTLSADNPKNDYPVHKLMLGAGKYLIENVASINRLPLTGSIVCAMPIKISQGTEAPIRLFAIIPASKIQSDC